MGLTSFYLTNELYLSIFNLLIVTILAFLISLKVDRLYQFSNHKGIRLFRHAFLFFSVAFFTQAIILIAGIWIVPPISKSSLSPLAIRLFIGVLHMIFAYTITLSGFYIVYSLIWKKVNSSSKFVTKIKILSIHLIAFAIAIIYIFFPGISVHFLFIPQLCVLSYGIYVCYNKYQNIRKHNRQGFLQLYLITLILMFIGWFFNYITGFVRSIYKLFPLYTQILTLGIFVIFIYGVMKITKRF